MDENRKEEFIRAAYREFLSAKVRRSELEKEKKSFLEKYFRDEPLWAPVFLAPSACLLALFLLFCQIQFSIGVLNFQRFAGPEMKTPAARPREDLPLPKELVARESAVEVKRITSRMGTPMVYQKWDLEIPITVAWVFPGEKNQ